jgi:hypothetical protein
LLDSVDVPPCLLELAWRCFGTQTYQKKHLNAIHHVLPHLKQKSSGWDGGHPVKTTLLQISHRSQQFAQMVFRQHQFLSIKAQNPFLFLDQVRIFKDQFRLLTVDSLKL